MVYKKKNPIRIYLFYIMAFIALLSSLFVLLTKEQSYVAKSIDTWQNYASFDFEQEEVDQDGENVLVNYISTPEQLAGAFIAINNSADEAKGEDAVNDKELQKLGIQKSVTEDKKVVFRLKNSISLAGKVWEPFNLDNKTSVFDGGSFTISDLTITSTFCNIGFIAKNCGTIQNLFLRNVNVSSTGVKGKVTYTGAVCGRNEGTIISVKVISGTVKGNAFDKDDNPRCVGGICGLNTGSIISCSNSADVKVGKYLGGIVGKSESGAIKNCSNFGDVCEPYQNKHIFMGGIVGESSSPVTACANYGIVDDSTINSSEWDIDVNDSSVGGIVGAASASVYSCGNFGTVSGGGVYYIRTVTTGGGKYTGVVTLKDLIGRDYITINDPGRQDDWRYSYSTMSNTIKNLNSKISTMVHTSGGSSNRGNSTNKGNGVIIDNVAVSVPTDYAEIYVHTDFTDHPNYYRPGEKTDVSYSYIYGDVAYVGGVVGYAYENSVKIYDSFNLGNVFNNANRVFVNFCDAISTTTDDYVAIYPLYDAESEESNSIIGCYELKNCPILGYGVFKSIQESGYRYVNENTLRSASILSSLGANWAIRDYTNNGDPFPKDLFW